MRRRLNLAAPAVREHVLAHHKDVLRRLHEYGGDGGAPVPDDFELRVMAGEPIDVHSYELPGEVTDYGLTVHDRVRIHGDGHLEVLT